MACVTFRAVSATRALAPRSKTSRAGRRGARGVRAAFARRDAAGESAGAASSLPALFSGAASTALAAKPEPRRAVTPATPPSRSGRRGMPRFAESCARTRLRVREGGQTREALVVKAARAADIIPGTGESRDESVAGLGCVGRVERVDECCSGGDRD